MDTHHLAFCSLSNRRPQTESSNMEVRVVEGEERCITERGENGEAEESLCREEGMFILLLLFLSTLLYSSNSY